MSASVGTKQSRLVNLAGEMRTVVEGSHAQSRSRLPQGLEILLQRQDGRRRLTLAREGRFPSEEELDACLTAIHVPVGAAQRRSQQCIRHPKSGRRMVVSVIEVCWTERNNDHTSQA